MSNSEGGSVLSELARHIKGIYKAVVGTRDNLPPHARKILASEGDTPVSSIDIIRRPLGKTYNTVLNVLNKISGKEQVHDKLYHLYLKVTLSNAHEYVMEKNEDPNLEEYKRSPLPEDVVHVDQIPSGLTMNNMINNGINYVGKTNFFHYSPFQWNCQAFVYNMLKGNYIEVSPKVKDFILQEVANLAPKWSQRVATFLTDLKSRLNMAYNGYGLGAGGQWVDPRDLPISFGSDGGLTVEMPSWCLPFEPRYK